MSDCRTLIDTVDLKVSVCKGKKKKILKFKCNTAVMFTYCCLIFEAFLHIFLIEMF